MNPIKVSGVVMCFLLAGSIAIVKAEDTNTKINFDSRKHQFTETEQKEIASIIKLAVHDVRVLMPNLDKNIEVQVNTIDRNIDMVGGVYGRAEAPGVISINLSTVAPNGVLGAAKTALRSSMFHELHHLVMGWTMTENKYGNPAGIPIATVNEGLANVFAETYTDEYFKVFDYPENVHEWLPEVLALPKDANYSHWVGGVHPDGRAGIGYRLGRYVVHQAQQKSGKDILQLSKMRPDEIIELVK